VIKPQPPRKPRRPVSLAEALTGCIAPALRRQGFGEAEIVTDWPQIVGARLAGVSAPVRLVWPPSPPRAAPEEARPATLCVRVEGAFAIEMQHLAPLIMERVNARLGWRCVARLQLLQGPLPRPRARAPRAPEPTAAEAKRAEALAQGVDEEGLRAALARLGARVLAEGRGDADSPAGQASPPRKDPS
jgi:hypothetical protein